VSYTSGGIRLLSTCNSQENYSRENPVMLKISFGEFGMNFKNAIIIASDIGDLIYKESNRKGELSERRGRKTRDLLDERTYGCRGYLQMSPFSQR